MRGDQDNCEVEKMEHVRNFSDKSQEIGPCKGNTGLTDHCESQRSGRPTAEKEGQTG